MTAQSNKANLVKAKGAPQNPRKKAAAKRERARPASDALDSIHQLVGGLHEKGLASKQTMREFDAMCLAPAAELKPEQIVEIRERANMSQPVFALWLGTTKSTVAQWESGAKKPSGTSRRLLAVVARHGVQILG